MPGLAYDSVCPRSGVFITSLLLLLLYRERGHDAHVSFVCIRHDNLEAELVSQVKKRLDFQPESLNMIEKLF